MTPIEDRLGRAIARWVRFVSRHARLTLACAAAFTLAALVVAGLRLGVVSDTDELFAASLPFRALRIEVEEALPLRADTILVVVDGPSEVAAGDAALELASELVRHGDPFDAVFTPGLGDFFQRNGFLYLELDALDDLAETLTRAQPFLAELRRDPSVRGVFDQLSFAAAHSADATEGSLDLGSVFDSLLGVLADAEALDPHPTAFGDLVLGATSEGRARRFVIVKPVLDRGDFVPGGAAVEALREVLAVRQATEDDIGFAVTGDLALKADEFSTVAAQARIAGLVSFIMVFVILWWALASWRLISSAIGTLLAGLFWTTGFAAVAVGHMNLISVTFVVLFIGLAIDFAIHFTMRYQELRSTAVAHGPALEETARGVGGSLVLCAATTAIGFYAFVPTPYLGVAELGLISGTGMFLSLLATLTVLPASLSLGDPGTPLRQPASRRIALPSWPVRWPRAVVLGSLGLAAGAAWFLPGLTFDANPLNVRDPNVESVRAFEELIADKAVNPWGIDILAGDLDAAQVLAEHAEALESVASARTLASYVPTGQAEKLEVIETLAYLLEPPSAQGLAAPTSDQIVASIQTFRETLRSLEAPPDEAGLADVARRLGAALDRFLVQAATEPAALDALKVSLVGAILDRVERLDRALQAGPVALADLPPGLRDRMLAADGRALVEVLPAEDLNDEAALANFVAEVRTMAPEATGASVYMFEASRAIMAALKQALVTALLLVGAIVLLLWRSLRDTLLVLAPLLLSGVVVGAVSVLAGLPVNFADVIVVPLLLGIGIDSGIHLVHRHRDGGSDERTAEGLLTTSTPRAILWSALSTIASFASLGFATHLGMASLGQLLTLGVIVMLLANLIFLPALLAWGSPGAVRA